jgi:hypothetical protein
MYEFEQILISQVHAQSTSSFTSETELVFYYFQLLYFGKPHLVPISSHRPQKRISIRIYAFLRIGFILTRFLAYGKLLYFILQLNGLFNGIHGPLQVYDELEIYLWILCTLFCVADSFMHSSKFLRDLDRAFILFNGIWTKILGSVDRTESQKIRSLMRRNVLRFVKHAG